jgi:hypothetical protein
MSGSSKIVTDQTSYDGEPRALPDVVSEHYTEVDGVEVIARELATSPHPRWKDQHPQTHHFVTKLLLADGGEVYECNHCHLHDPELKSIKAHLTKHRPNPPQPLTDVETIRTVLREVERARRLYGVGRYGKYAVEALTRLGVRPATGDEWTVAKVTSLYGSYKDRYPVRAPKVTPRSKPRPTAVARPVPAPAAAAPAPGQAVVSSSDRDLMQLLVQVDAAIHHAMRLVASVNAPDEQIVEKAAMLDRLVAGLGEDTINKLLA